MSSGRRGRAEDEDEDYSEGEGDGSGSQEQPVFDNREVDDGDGGDGDGGGGDGGDVGDGGDGGAEDLPKTLSEVHAMLTTLLRHLTFRFRQPELKMMQSLSAFEGSNRR